MQVVETLARPVGYTQAALFSLPRSLPLFLTWLEDPGLLLAEFACARLCKLVCVGGVGAKQQQRPRRYPRQNCGKASGVT